MARELGKMELTDPEAAEDEEVELTLRLSIGGDRRKVAKRGVPDFLRRSESAGAFREANADLSGGDRVPSFFHATFGDDPQRRRGLHAVGRQDTRRKSGGGPARVCSMEDRKVLEAQELQSRARDREVRENEARRFDRWLLGRKCREIDDPIPEIAGIHNPIPNPNPKPDPAAFPVMPMQYHYGQVQYVPVANRFGVPYMVPCWAPAIPSASNGSSRPVRNVYQPVASLFPAPALQSNGCCMELNGRNGVAVKPALLSTDSRGGSSSDISVHQIGPLHEGSSSSSDAKSHAIAEKPRPQAALSSQVSNPGQIGSSTQATEEGGALKLVSRTAQSPPPHRRKLEGAASVNKPISTAGSPTKTASLPSSLPRMPCVETTGNGPNGKTVMGLLYRYNAVSEVSIVCVCHGESFSPAEFVRHAGGTDVSNPLKQIVVVPS